MERNVLIRKLANAIEASFNKSDWKDFGYEFNIISQINRHERLLRSLDWGDPDYRANIFDVLESLSDEGLLSALRFPKIRTALEEVADTGDSSGDSRAPTVFVSYAWETDAHQQWVLKLVQDLRLQHGVDARLDLFEAPGTKLPQFMESSSFESDFVVCVCTARYAEKADANQGGVGTEKSLVLARLNDGVQDNRIIGVLRGNRSSSIPRFLKAKIDIDFTDDSQYQVQLEKLARAIWRKPEIVPAPLGQPWFSSGGGSALAFSQPAAQGQAHTQEQLGLEIVDGYVWPSIPPFVGVAPGSGTNEHVRELLYLLRLRVLNRSEKATSLLSLTGLRSNGGRLELIRPRLNVEFPGGSFRAQSFAENEYWSVDYDVNVDPWSSKLVKIWLKEDVGGMPSGSIDLTLTAQTLETVISVLVEGIPVQPGRTP